MIRKRSGKQLGALGGGERFVLQGAGDRREARLGRSHGWVDVGLEGVFELGDGLAHRLGQRHVVIEQKQGVGAGAEGVRPGRRCRQLARGGRGVPGRDHGQAGVVAQDGGEVAALALEGAGGAAEEDGERRAVAEALAGEGFAAGRGGAVDIKRGRAQVVLDAEADQAEPGDGEKGGGEGGDGAAARAVLSGAVASAAGSDPRSLTFRRGPSLIPPCSLPLRDYDESRR